MLAELVMKLLAFCRTRRYTTIGFDILTAVVIKEFWDIIQC
jgi:hypothetical protein